MAAAVRVGAIIAARLSVFKTVARRSALIVALAES
jgi:hypothetical protein